ncbi:DUF7677 family protein [Rugosimonospora acidiphila]|uniref:DUF7677 family protein n=1 Tax=Rugosimonospora acidiphila TaxID=556531 RepID=UPI003CD0B17D
MTSHLSPGASGAIRRFAGWVARGSVGHRMLEGINYSGTALADFPPAKPTCRPGSANSSEAGLGRAEPDEPSSAGVRICRRTTLNQGHREPLKPAIR